MPTKAFFFAMVVIGIATVFVLDTVHKADPSFIQGSFFGFTCCLGLEVMIICLWFYARLSKKQKESKITLRMMKLELNELFADETEEQTIARFKARSFFVNKFSHEKKMMSRVYRQDGTYTYLKEKEDQAIEAHQLSQDEDRKSRQTNSETKNQQQQQQQQQQQDQDNGNPNASIEGKEEKKKHIFEAVKSITFDQLGKKIFLTKVNTFRRFLETFISLQKNFAKDLKAIGKPRFLKTSMFEIVVRRDDRYQHSYKMSEIESQYRIDYQSVVLLTESKSNSMDGVVVILPNWMHVKNLFLEVSRIHDQLVQYIQFGIFDLSKVLIEEFEDSYKKLKVLKTAAQEQIEKKMEEAKTQEKTYQEISKRIKDLAAVYEKQHSTSGEKELARKRVEMKGEIELLLYDKNNSKIKVYAGYEALRKAKQEANKVNAKIAQHKKNWEKRFQSMFKTSMKSIISGFFEIARDIRKNLRSILVSKPIVSTSHLIPHDLQSFRDDLSVYSSIAGSQQGFQERDNRQRNMSFNSLGSMKPQTLNPSLIGADHRQQFMDFLKSAECYEQDLADIVKYDEEVSILMEDICSAVSGYLSELESKITKGKFFGNLGESLIYEQLGSCIQLDITNSSKAQFREMISKISSYLNPFQMQSSKVAQQLGIEVKRLRSSVSHVQDQQSVLDRLCAAYTSGKESLHGFQVRYDQMKVNFDGLYERVYVSRAEIDKMLLMHEKAVEEYKRKVINALVVFSNHMLENLEMIENNSDNILTQDEDNNDFQDQSMVSSVHSNKTQASQNTLNLKRQSSNFFLGFGDFMHGDHDHPSSPAATANAAFTANASANDPSNRKAAEIVTRLLKVFYHQWKDADYFKEKIKKELYISLNKKLEDSLEEMIITKLIIKGQGPDVKSIVQQKSEDNEFLLDLELSFKGTIYLEVDTAYYLDWPDKIKIPLTIKIRLNEFYSILRVCYVPRVFGKSWFSFIGEPVLSLDIDPIVSNKYQVSKIPHVQTLIQDIISKKIKKMTFPNRDSIKIPLSKADKEISAIREKLLHKKESPKDENAAHRKSASIPSSNLSKQ